MYVGCVGKDKYADILTEACAQAGLRTEYRYDESTPTGRCGVIITGHHRSMVTDLAAANKYQVEHLKTGHVWDLVQNAKVYYVGGYHLTVCVPAIMALAEEAASKNKIFALSLSAPFIPQFFAEPLQQVLPYCDYVIGNETEAMAHSEKQNLGTKEITAIAAAIAKLPKVNAGRPRTVIITQGTEPTVVAVGNTSGAEPTIKEFAVKKIDESEINDTNGAGDAFAGGFMAGVVQGKTLEKSMDMGQWLARLSIKELGPSYPYPKQTYAEA